MGYSDNKVTAPVSTDDVSAVLGVASHDIGTLCYSEKINGWAKYKPVKSDSPIVTESSWRADDGDCGLIVPVVYDQAKNIINNWELFLKYYYRDNNGWEYRRLSDGDWAALDAFDGYIHKAFPPFGDGIGDTNVTIRESQADSITLPLIRNIAYQTLGITDFGSMASMPYFGVLITGSTNGRTAQNLIITNSHINLFSSFTIANPQLPAGEYLAYYLIGDKVGTYDYEADDEIAVAPLPVVAPIKFTILKDDTPKPTGDVVAITIHKTQLDKNNGITVYYTIKNISSTAVTIFSIDIDVFAKSTDTTAVETVGQPISGTISLPVYDENIGAGTYSNTLRWVSSVANTNAPKIAVRVNTGLKTTTKEAPLFTVA